MELIMAGRAAALSPIGMRIRASLASISPSNPSLLLSKHPVSGRFGLSKVWPKCLRAVSPIHAPGSEPVFNFQRIIRQSFKPSERKFLTGSLLGFTAVAGMMNHQSHVAYAMDDFEDIEEPSGYLNDDLNAFWTLARKFQLPAVLLMTVLLGWRHPVTLAINIALLLFCTRPSPFSVYIFIEQLRQRDMRRDPRLHKSKFFYAKKVEVEDYKFLCLAKVELRDVKLKIIGLLGGWWVIHNSRI
ncbi:hypothetical protein COCNU_05G011030 [Cocos nucifera]|uniref:Uncharacterized protein n=1 Tax=Cocos nucifera TaxID=13894 RepID=A0A8K0IA05_COCNU|nr:hypothetical protein COCNU_05G011030 [Cocos nucifera]